MNPFGVALSRWTYVEWYFGIDRFGVGFGGEQIADVISRFRVALCDGEISSATLKVNQILRMIIYWLIDFLPAGYILGD